MSFNDGNLLVTSHRQFACPGSGSYNSFDLIFLVVSFFGWRGLPAPMSWLYGRMAAFMCWS
jgi:hypothetical protein